MKTMLSNFKESWQEQYDHTAMIGLNLKCFSVCTKFISSLDRTILYFRVELKENDRAKKAPSCVYRTGQAFPGRLSHRRASGKG